MLNRIFKTPHKIFFSKEFNCFYSINELIEILDQSFILRVETVNNFINYYPSDKCYKQYIFSESVDLLTKKQLNVLVQYASPNPVSHIHFGNLVNAVYGNSFFTFLKTKYTNVISQFYVNDLGTVIGKSVYASSLNPQLDYSAAYTNYIASKYTSELSQIQLLSTYNVLRLDIVNFNLAHILRELSEFLILFNKFQYESKQITGFQIIKTTHSTCFEEKDTLLYFILSNTKKILCNKSNGDLLYFSKDLALNYKRLTTYDLTYIILGEDHKLYVADLIKCLTKLLNKSTLFPLFTPTITADNLKMSKRTGNVLLVKDILKDFQLDLDTKLYKINNLKLHILLSVCKNYETNISKTELFETIEYYFNTLSKIKETLDLKVQDLQMFSAEDYALINYKIYCMVNLQHITFTKFLNEFHFYFKKGINYLNQAKINNLVLNQYYNFLIFLFNTINLSF